MKVLQTVTEKFTVNNNYLQNAFLAFETRVSHLSGFGGIRPKRVQFELEQSDRGPDNHDWVVTFEYVVSALVSDEPAAKNVYSVPDTEAQEGEAA